MDYRDKSYNLSQYADSRNLCKRISIYRYNTNPRNWFEWLFDQMPFRGSDKIIELGCGNGSLWARNAARIPAGAEITLTDLNENMLRDCERSLREAAPMGTEGRFRFGLADLSAIAYPPASFTMAVANHVLYHVPDLDRALSGIVAVLSPGGALVASTIGIEDNKELAEVFAGYSSSLAYDPARIAAAFGLENGRAILERHFSRVERRDFENSLSIDDPRPVLDYALSVSGAAGAIADQTAFLAYVRERMERSGGRLVVTKRTGVFVATS